MIQARLARQRSPSMLAILCVLVGVNACSETRSVIEASRQLAKAESKSPVKKATQPAQPPQSKTVPVLHVDGSQSMAGFTNCMRAPTHYDIVFDRLTVGLGITSVSRFGGVGAAARAGGEEVPLSSAPHCPTFYSHLQNPDYQLFRAIAADKSGAVHLYITDGVQSDVAGTNQSPSVQSLAGWLAEGHALAVLAFRSRFEGRAWSESRKQWIGSITTNRPFYVFAFARTEAALDASLHALPPAALDSAVVMRFAPEGVRCAIGPGKVAKQTADPALHWVMLTQAATKTMHSTAVPIASYDCHIQTTFPLASVRSRVAETRYGRWNGASFEFQAGAPSGSSFSADSTVRTSDGSSAIVRAVAGDDPSTRFGFFELRLVPEPGSLKPAIAALSTDSDAQVADYARTYRFGWVTEQLARALVARTLSDSRLYFTTYYR